MGNMIITPDVLAKENKSFEDRYRIGQEVFSQRQPKVARAPHDPRSWIERAIRSRRHTNPFAPYMADVVPWSYYDSNTVANGSATTRNIQFFVTEQGQSSKTKVHTNMEKGGELPAPQIFNAQYLGVYIMSNVTVADIRELEADYWLELTIGGKVYAEGKLFQFPGGSGIVGPTTANDVTFYKFGEAIKGNVWDLRLPPNVMLEDTNGQLFPTDGIIGQVITEGESFKVELKSDDTFTVGSPAPGLRVYVLLDGILSRGVR